MRMERKQKESAGGAVSSQESCSLEKGKGQKAEGPFGAVLPFAEVQIEGRFEGKGGLPPFRGATLRGGLGYHLKQTVCHRKQSTCQDCIVRTTCAYSCIFEGIPPQDRQMMRLYPYVPQPFTLLVNSEDPAQIEPGNPFSFGMRLFGRAIELFPYIAYSFIEMGKEGLGKDRIPFQITRIVQPSFGAEIYHEQGACLHKVQTEYPQNLLPACKRIRVEFVTPVRLRVNGREPSTLRFENLIRAIVRRFSILTYFYGTPTENLSIDYSAVAAVTSVCSQTKPIEFRRFSGRQKRPVKMSGLVGSAIYEGNLEPFLPWLSIARIIGVGKATSFGFGRIQITPLQPDNPFARG